MSKREFTRPNALGDLRAEADERMLKLAFLETADYRTLIETSDRTIVVGRRGTGKSALTINLQRYWGRAEDTHVIKIAPEEHQTIGLRPQVALFGDTFSKIRAGARLAWRYALLMEAADALSRTYRFSNTDGFRSIEGRLNRWCASGFDVIDRNAAILKQSIDRSLTPEERIGNIAVTLDLKGVENALADACKGSRDIVILLIDRLDEGYEPDDKGVGIVDGLVQAAIDLKTRLPNVKPVIFLRDNIFRAVQAYDIDYSRNIEGHVLRLHWDEDALFTFAAKRLRLAFEVDQEATQKIWNHCVGSDLRNKDGFVRCLQHTLYRPRDVLSLLNEAFYLASKDGQFEIMAAHVERAGETISQNRLDDLKKEYQQIIPSLDGFISGFEGAPPEMSVSDGYEILQGVLEHGSDDPVVQQDFFILGNAQEALRGLYSVGFFGIRDSLSGHFVFSHDGRAPEREFSERDRLLIHPCYWMALNCIRSIIEQNMADEIYDEYDIEVSSETPAIRNAKIDELISQLSNIPDGATDSAAFESWCQKAIRICFAKGLRNVELKANKLAKMRRDVVATNLGEGDAWRRIYDDYGTRQVTFEIKNYKSLEASDYQQVVTYLNGDYGRLAFVVTKEDSVDLYAGKDVEWVRELWATHRVLVIKLTGKFLSDLLRKLKNPQKHDAVNDAVHRLLDTYSRLYVAGEAHGKQYVRKRGERSIKSA